MEDIGSTLPPPQQLDYDETVAALEAAIGADRMGDLLRQGRQMRGDGEIERILPTLVNS